MSSVRSASAITSLPKPGALTPAGVGRSIPATAGSASLVLARAVAEVGGVIAVFLSAEVLASYGDMSPARDRGRGAIQPDRCSMHKRPRTLAERRYFATLMILGADARAVLRRHSRRLAQCPTCAGNSARRRWW